MSQQTETGGGAARPVALILVLLAGLFLGAGAVVLTHPGAGAGVSPPAPPPPELARQDGAISVPAGSFYRRQIGLSPVVRRDRDQTLSLPAVVENDPAQVTNVLPPLGGRVVQLKVELGDQVSKGQVLVVIESGDLAQAVSDVEKARAQAILARNALQRARALDRAGGGAAKDTESAANDSAQADDELSRAQNRLATLRGAGNGSAGSGGKDMLTVLAPVSGVVTALSTSAGAYINDPTQSLMTIANLDHVWITADVPEQDVRFVSKGQPLEIRFPAYQGEVFHSAVIFVDDVLDPATRRVKVHAALPDADGRFKPNMFATVTLHAPPTSILLVPNGALLMNNDSTSVFMQQGDWRFVRRDVRTGEQQGDETEITGGLSAGDVVVSRGGVLLND